MSNKVVITQGKDALTAVLHVLEVDKKLRGCKKVFLKPNLRAAAVKDFNKGSVTNIAVIYNLVDFLRERGLIVSLGECTSSKLITENALARSGILSLRNRGIKVLNLNKESVKRINLPHSLIGYLEVPLPILETDCLISLPVMKTHSATGVSLSLKNMMGAVAETMPPKMHLKGLHKSIADINKVLKPSLSLIDATWAMEGTGPVLGTALHLNTIIGGFDPVSVDATAAKIMGFNPRKIEHLVFAELEKIGSIEPDEIVGNIRSHKFRESRHTFWTDLYSHGWFNFIMSIRPFHKFFYDYAYFTVKLLLRKLSPADRQ